MIPESTAPAAAAPAAEMGGRGLLARRASVVSAAVLASRVLGVVREQVFAVFFGAGRELDAFITAFRIPNLLRDLFAEGALSAAFVSTFTQHLERGGDAAAWRLASLVINALAVVVGLLTLLGMWVAPAIVEGIAPGFADIPGKVPLTVELTRIMFPFLPLVALAAVAMGILNTRNVFGVPASAAAFFNVGSIVGGLAAAYWMAPAYVHGIVVAVAAHRQAPTDPALAARAITGMAIGTLIGGLLQVLVQVPVIGLIYEHGRFTAADTTAAAQALAAYTAGLAGYAGIKVLAPAFYALDDARTPMLVSLVSIAVNYALNWTFVRRLGFGHVGLALSTSAVALGNFGLLYLVLRRRIGALGGRLRAAPARIALAPAVMAAVAGGLDVVVAAHLPAAGALRHALRLAVAMPVAAVCFWATCRALGVAVPLPRRRRG